MSGSNTIPPIPLRFEGAENVQRTIDAIVARVGQLESAGKGAAASMGTLRTQAEQTGGGVPQHRPDDRPGRLPGAGFCGAGCLAGNRR
jgi:hypothetical protein